MKFKTIQLLGILSLLLVLAIKVPILSPFGCGGGALDEEDSANTPAHTGTEGEPVGTGGSGGSGTTKSGDLTVTSFVPPDGATNVALNTSVQVNFSKDVDSNTVTSSTLSVAAVNASLSVKDALLQGVDADTVVSASISASGKSAYVIPAAVFIANTTYRISLTQDVKASDGTQIQKAYTSTFTTGISSYDVLATGIATPVRLICTTTHCLFFRDAPSTSDGAICSVPIGGGSVTCFSTGLYKPVKMSLDNDNVYFAEDYQKPSSDKKIYSCPLSQISSSCNKQTVASDSSATYVNGIPVGSRGIFYGDGTSTIKVVSLSTGLSTTVCGGLTTPVETVIDTTNVTFTHGSDFKTIGTCAQDGSGSATNLATATNNIGDIQTDGSYVYFNDGANLGSGGVIKRVPVTGGSASSISSSNLSIGYDDMVLSGDFLYVYASGSVLKIRKDGSSETTLTNSATKGSISVQGSYLYFFVSEGGSTYSLARVPL